MMPGEFYCRKLPRVVIARGPLTEAETVRTANGEVDALAGDYVVRDPATGDKWPVAGLFFDTTYERIAVEEEEPEFPAHTS